MICDSKGIKKMDDSPGNRNRCAKVRSGVILLRFLMDDESGAISESALWSRARLMNHGCFITTVDLSGPSRESARLATGTTRKAPGTWSPASRKRSRHPLGPRPGLRDVANRSQDEMAPPNEYPVITRSIEGKRTDRRNASTMCGPRIYLAGPRALLTRFNSSLCRRRARLYHVLIQCPRCPHLPESLGCFFLSRFLPYENRETNPIIRRERTRATRLTNTHWPVLARKRRRRRRRKKRSIILAYSWCVVAAQRPQRIISCSLSFTRSTVPRPRETRGYLERGPTNQGAPFRTSLLWQPRLVPPRIPSPISLHFHDGTDGPWPGPPFFFLFREWEAPGPTAAAGSAFSFAPVHKCARPNGAGDAVHARNWFRPGASPRQRGCRRSLTLHERTHIYLRSTL